MDSVKTQLIKDNKSEQTSKRSCNVFSARNSSVLPSRVVPLSSLLRSAGHRVVTGNTAAQYDRGRRSFFKRSGDRAGRVEFPG